MIILVYVVDIENGQREFNNLPDAQTFCIENNIDTNLIITKEVEIIPPPPEFERPSFAVDKGPDAGLDQLIIDITDAWEKVTATQILWDKSNDYILDKDTFEIKWDGIYFLDAQIRVTNFVNVESLELALFKETEDINNDDYWFILDQKPVNSDVIQLKGSTSFNFYAGERYRLKIKLKKIILDMPASAVISGNDDYTAWGLNYIRDL